MTDNSNDEQSQPGRELHAAPWNQRRRPPAPGVIIAILIIGVGVLLFLDNFGLFHIYNLWRYWPVVLIAVGVAKMLDCRGAGGRVWAGVMIAFGALFLLDSLRIYHIGWHLIWPLALVGLGISMLMKSLARKQPAGRCVTTSSGDASSTDTLREYVVFGGLKRRVDTANFQGGEMIAVFGGIEMDLRRAIIADSVKEVVIDANATFGGIEVKVPETWRIITRGFGIFGGYEDKTIPPKSQEGASVPTVVITGYAIFGGVAVQN